MPVYEFQCDKCGAVDCLKDDCDGVCDKILSAGSIIYEKKYYKDGKDWGKGMP